MSAQAEGPALTANGVDPDVARGFGEPGLPVRNDRMGGQRAGQSTGEQGTMGGDAENVSAGAGAPGVRSSEQLPSASGGPQGNESHLQHGRPTRSSTTVDVDGHPGPSDLAGWPHGAAGQAEFTTPRSTASVMGQQPSWMTGLEMPRWVSRLGSYLSVGHLDTLPSPLAGASATPSPPGGPTFRLRSPVRSMRPLPPPTPQEAIQAEVQRQLGGLLDRLQSAEQYNDVLRMELEATQRSLEQARQARSEPARARGVCEPAELRQGDLGQVYTGDPPPLPRAPAVSVPSELPLGDPLTLLAGQLGMTQPQPLPGTQGYFGDREQRPPIPTQPPEPMSTAPAPPPQPQQESRGFLCSFLGPQHARSQTPPPPRIASGSPPESPMMDALLLGVQQLQELQAAALAKGQSSSPEILKPGTSTLTPLPELSQGAEAALQFQDWLEVTSAAMSDVSDQSATWWREVVRAVDEAYQKWLASTPLERLGVQPGGQELSETKWTRLNARVTTMLLSAMSPEQRTDMISHRMSTSTVRMLFRLHTLYEPGGSNERQDLLRRLQNPLDFVAGDTMEGVLCVLRAWPRWMSRCLAVRMAPPDASVLARGLKILTAKYIEGAPDSNFRTSVLRTSLRLDGQPTMDNVYAYQKHLQAEIETLLASQPRTAASTPGEQPRLRALDKPQLQTGGQVQLQPQHEFVGARGQEPKSHRQKDCPIGRPGQRPPGNTSTSTTSPGGNKDRPITPAMSTMSTTATAGSTDSSSPSSTIQGTAWTLESLIQAAQQVVQAQTQSEDRSPEKTRPELKTIRVRDIRISAMSSSSSALLDSGATHSLRSAKDDNEWDQAAEVQVQLAGNNSLLMRMNTSGTLLMPPRGLPGISEGPSSRGQTIVPLGELVRTLGYTLVWSLSRCFLQTGDGEQIPLSINSGCPQLCEAEALSIISRLEDKNREKLENATVTTMDRLALAALRMQTYAATGNMDEGYRGLRDAGFLHGLPENVLMASSFRVYEMKDGRCSRDVSRCKAHNVMNESTWKLLLWGALTGRLDAIVGGPPGRSGMWNPKGELLSGKTRSLTTVVRMMWLYAVARATRSSGGNVLNKERPVAFVMEHPTANRGGGTSLWESTMWREFQQEMGMTEVSFNQEATGGANSPTTIGTNVYYLLGLNGLGGRDAPPSTEQGGEMLAAWSPDLVRAMVTALRFWDRRPMMPPAVAAMSAEQWRKHVQSNHAEYHRDCLTCVMSRGTGRRHARVRSPDMFNLTVDVAGPVKPGLDVSSKGTMGKGLRYMLVGRYVLPTETMVWVQLRQVMQRATATTKNPQDLLHHYHKKRGNVIYNKVMQRATATTKNPQDLLHHYQSLPQEEGEHDQQPAHVICDDNDKEPAGPSTPLPQEEGDPFVLSDDDPGEQSPLIVRDDDPGEQSPFPELFEQLERNQEGFVGGTQVQRDGYIDYEDSEYEPSVVQGEVQEQEESVQGPDRTTRVFPDCEEPESTYLLFARPLPNNGTQAIKGAIQDIILYLHSRGLPVYRLHSDKGETYNHSIRNWLRDQGIRATWSEPGKPQGNGQAESAVRWVKDHTRTLLAAARLPTRLWPSAAEAATALQRSRVLGWRTKMLAPFGATVHVRRKAFDSAGPLRREQAFESKWVKGTYVGLSNILDNGHVVCVEGTPEHKEKFMHTFHVRHRLVDPGPPQEELEVQTSLRPRRRVTEKKPMDQVELRQLALSQEERDDYIARKARFLLDEWDQDGAVRLVDELAEVGFFDEWKFGDRLGSQNFTAIWVARNAERGLHKDYNNDENAVNYVYPIRMPKRGGELWVELSPGDRVDGEITDRTDSQGKRRYGYLKKLQHGCCTVFSPRRAHEVLPWTGTRTVLIAYTPQCMGRLSTEMIHELETRGFQPPLSQYPEYFLAKDPQPMEAKVEVESHDQVEHATVEDLDGSDVEEVWEMYLDVDGGKVKIGDDETEHREQPRPRFMKVEAGFTKNVEAILQELKGPIEVTYNVDPKEVADNMGLWMGAIQKELDGVSAAIKKLLPNTEERVKWMRRPGAQKLPAKFVYTVKPAENPDPADKTTWFKRKARLVVCGNYASPDQSELYSETAPSEAVRAGLVMSRSYGPR
ncbi:unnamed protein product [Symbiodinium sp. CCMP2592]|nr:unnamed protein product [Symbiodinium sp. CCMP2592]